MYRFPIPPANEPDFGSVRSLFGTAETLPPRGERRTAKTAETMRIETRRLVLRGFRAADADDYAAMLADPDAFRYSERGPMNGTEAWTRLLRHAGHWSLLGYGLFAIEDKASGRFAGEAGFENFRRDLGPVMDGVPEASWTVAGWARGRGYATEAAHAVLEWLEEAVAPSRTVCIVHCENRSSLQVAAKLGFVERERRDYRGYPAVFFERGTDL